MKNILVLGANGFVGTHTSLALKKMPGVKMILGCRNPLKLLEELRDEELRIGDLRDETYLSRLFDGVDVVINLASWAALFGGERLSHELYLRPSLEVIDRAKKAGVKKYLNLSTLSAAPSDQAADANAKGRFRSFWPHLNSVVQIEDHLRQQAEHSFKVVNLRCGLFIGKHYALGLLPILLPRLKTHLVPLVKGGNTQMPLVSGDDIAQAFVRAGVGDKSLNDFEGFNIMGKEVPRVKEVLSYIHEKHNYPYPHFSVPFLIAYPFARLMELLDPIMPTDPLIVPSIIHLLEDTDTDNKKAEELLGYEPQREWRDVLDEQIEEIHTGQPKAMKMKKEVI